jgi:hypothetical protein
LLQAYFVISLLEFKAYRLTMAESSRTVTITNDEMNNFLDKEIEKEAKKALNNSEGGSCTWSGVEWFINWVREKVKDFFQNEISKIPIVGQWASRISVSISEFIFTVIGTFWGFLKVVFTSPKLWKMANEAAMLAWNSNEQNGLLAQTYAYGKKMASYFLEIIKQCFERAIKAHGLQVSDDEKASISSYLDDLL